MLINVISKLEVTLILAFQCHHVIVGMASSVCHTILWRTLDSKKVCTAVMIEHAKRVHIITVLHIELRSLVHLSTVIGHHATISVDFAMESSKLVQTPKLLFRFMIMKDARLESNSSTSIYSKIGCQTPLLVIPIGDEKCVIILIPKLSLAAAISSTERRCFGLDCVSKNYCSDDCKQKEFHR
jgi:hypothetical protein